jgi:hypothetical protein
MMFKASVIFVSGNASNGIINNSPMNMGGGGGQGPMLGGGKGSTQVTIPKDVCIHYIILSLDVLLLINSSFLCIACCLNTFLKRAYFEIP